MSIIDSFEIYECQDLFCTYHRKISNFYNNHIYFMKDYSEDLAAVHGVRTYYKKPINFDMLKGIVRDTISEEFLPEHFKSEI